MDTEISIIIPVCSETSIINQTIEHIHNGRYAGPFEIIVVDGSPSGETIAAIRREDVIKLLSEKGRARQMNKGASIARGKVLLFLHADTLLPGSALKDISSLIERGDCVGGAFDLSIRSGKPIFRLIECAASLRSRLTRVPYGDQAIFIRKDRFDAIGGYRELPLLEDVDLMRRIKRAGHTVYIFRQRVSTSPRRWEREGIIYGTLRNRMIMALYLCGVPPEKLAKYYR